MCSVTFTWTCSALVQPVEPDDVLLAHLRGHSKLNTGVGNSNQCGLVVLGESVPKKKRIINGCSVGEWSPWRGTCKQRGWPDQQVAAVKWNERIQCANVWVRQEGKNERPNNSQEMCERWVRCSSVKLGGGGCKKGLRKILNDINTEQKHRK